MRDPESVDVDGVMPSSEAKASVHFAGLILDLDACTLAPGERARTDSLCQKPKSCLVISTVKMVPLTVAIARTCVPAVSTTRL
jgi:hypothetical protein